jgi:hypothetical protein
VSRKPKDLTVWHGHRVVDGSELRSQFAPDPDNSRLLRRIWHGFMLTLLVAIVVSGAWTAWAILTGNLVLPQAAPSASAPLGCPQGPFDYAAPDSVHVNVYNAAAKEGLARSVADQLAQRKFAIGKVDNAKGAGPTPALIVSGPAGESAAFTLQRNVPGSVFSLDSRGDASVDLVLLPSFKQLQDASLVDQTPGPLMCAGATQSPQVPVTPAPLDTPGG